MDSTKRETMIKEIKTIYSGKIRSTNPLTTTPHIASMNPLQKGEKRNTFFNNIVDKLNIVVTNK